MLTSDGVSILDTAKYFMLSNIDIIRRASGKCNVGIGTHALGGATCGCTNIGIGLYAIYGTTIGNCNVAIGTATLKCLTSGCDNVALGQNALANSLSNPHVHPGIQLPHGSDTNGIVKEMEFFDEYYDDNGL